MKIKKEVKEDFNLEFLGYKKSEVDLLINALSEKIEILSKDIAYLKSENKKNNKRCEKLLKPTSESN